MIQKCVSVVMLMGLCSGIIGCSNAAMTKKEQTSVQTPVAATTPVQTTTEIPSQVPSKPEDPPLVPPQDIKVTLMAVGDIMVHQEQLEAAWDAKSKTYDFAPFFSKVTPIFQEADWVIGNLETTLSGSASRYTGYPEFNTPESLALTLKQAGFTAVTTANNHSLDRREAGVLKTIEHLDRAGLAHTGTFRNPSERDEPLFLEKDGITLAVLAYTYGTNGIPIPKGKPYLVNLIQPQLIKQDIARARALGADFVAVALHFGAEYQRMPNDSQRTIADLCLQYGADLILGAHPHVVQPYEWRTVTLENGQQHTGFVAYSLGNFISAQRRDYKDVGAILKLTLVKRATGEAKLESAELIPTYVHYYRKDGKRKYVVYPLPQTLQAVNVTKDPMLTKDLLAYLKRLYKEMTVHVLSLTAKKKAS
ncbi:CapA family protein [Brevibacillus sp. H7]|uniref:CapA family protein n=1 Tax=Brevibacillus sp. H7 TaxID=3349138 RepID=UPI0037F5BFD2